MNIAPRNEVASTTKKRRNENAPQTFSATEVPIITANVIINTGFQFNFLD
jgi:hypothetical protein